jgi:hypothetical protein
MQQKHDDSTTEEEDGALNIESLVVLLAFTRSSLQEVWVSSRLTLNKQVSTHCTVCTSTTGMFNVEYSLVHCIAFDCTWYCNYVIVTVSPM